MSSSHTDNDSTTRCSIKNVSMLGFNVSDDVEKTCDKMYFQELLVY